MLKLWNVFSDNCCIWKYFLNFTQGVMSNSVILSEHPQVTKYGFLYLTTHSLTKTLLSWCTKRVCTPHTVLENCANEHVQYFTFRKIKHRAIFQNLLQRNSGNLSLVNFTHGNESTHCVFIKETLCKPYGKHFQCLCLLYTNELKIFHDEWFFFSKTGLFHTTEIDQYVNSCHDNTQSIV